MNNVIGPVKSSLFFIFWVFTRFLFLGGKFVQAYDFIQWNESIDSHKFTSRDFFYTGKVGYSQRITSLLAFVEPVSTKLELVHPN